MIAMSTSAAPRGACGGRAGGPGGGQGAGGAGSDERSPVRRSTSCGSCSSVCAGLRAAEAGGLQLEDGCAAVACGRRRVGEAAASWTCGSTRWRRTPAATSLARLRASTRSHLSWTMSIWTHVEPVRAVLKSQGKEDSLIIDAETTTGDDEDDGAAGRRRGGAGGMRLLRRRPIATPGRPSGATSRFGEWHPWQRRWRGGRRALSPATPRIHGRCTRGGSGASGSTQRVAAEVLQADDTARSSTAAGRLAATHAQPTGASTTTRTAASLDLVGAARSGDHAARVQALSAAADAACASRSSRPRATGGLRERSGGARRPSVRARAPGRASAAVAADRAGVRDGRGAPPAGPPRRRLRARRPDCTWRRRLLGASSAGGPRLCDTLAELEGGRARAVDVSAPRRRAPRRRSAARRRSAPPPRCRRGLRRRRRRPASPSDAVAAAGVPAGAFARGRGVTTFALPLAEGAAGVDWRDGGGSRPPAIFERHQRPTQSVTLPARQAVGASPAAAPAARASARAASASAAGFSRLGAALRHDCTRGARPSISAAQRARASRVRARRSCRRRAAASGEMSCAPRASGGGAESATRGAAQVRGVEADRAKCELRRRS